MSPIDPELLYWEVAEANHDDFWAGAQPFPHIVFDDFLTPEAAKLLATELENTPLDGFHRADHAQQVNKFWMQDFDRMPYVTASVLRQLNAPSTIAWLQRLTHIDGLQPDDELEGGGIHIHTTGGRLGIHADFNQHPRSGLWRRLNLLIFLNRGWEPEWGGQLELWSSTECDVCKFARTAQPAPGVTYFINPANVVTQCMKCGGLGYLPDKQEVIVEPVFNRAVLLNINDRAFHGVPTTIACPPERRRISLALYYYSADRPEGEKADFHWSTWPTG